MVNIEKNGLVIFGVSNLMGDIFDCALALSIPIKAIVMNQPEITRERTKNLYERIKRLAREPEIITLEHFSPFYGDEYILGTSSPKRYALVHKLVEDYKISFRNLIHPTAYISPSVTLGTGVFVGANTAIGAEVKLGNHIYINRNVSVGHDCIVSDYARLNPGCNIAGHVTIGASATIGIGATIIEELIIGDNCLVAAGAVVTGDVASNSLVAGTPAKFKKTL